jgi:hypothetical protein
MWRFTWRRRPKLDPLCEDIDLSRLAPFVEAERYLLVYPVAVGVHYGLVVVFEAASGERVHVMHSPGLDHGGGMENFVEWVATAVRVRDPRAVALLTSWPTDKDRAPVDDHLMRHVMGPNPSGVASPSTTVLMSSDGSVVDNVLTRDRPCPYSGSSFWPRLSPQEWTQILGTPVTRLSMAEWTAAADLVDPDRATRDAAEREAAGAVAVLEAFLDDVTGETPVS